MLYTKHSLISFRSFSTESPKPYINIKAVNAHRSKKKNDRFEIHTPNNHGQCKQFDPYTKYTPKQDPQMIFQSLMKGCLNIPQFEKELNLFQDNSQMSEKEYAFYSILIIKYSANPQLLPEHLRQNLINGFISSMRQNARRFNIYSNVGKSLPILYKSIGSIEKSMDQNINIDLLSNPILYAHFFPNSMNFLRVVFKHFTNFLSSELFQQIFYLNLPMAMNLDRLKYHAQFSRYYLSSRNSVRPVEKIAISREHMLNDLIYSLFEIVKDNDDMHCRFIKGEILSTGDIEEIFSKFQKIRGTRKSLQSFPRLISSAHKLALLYRLIERIYKNDSIEGKSKVQDIETSKIDSSNVFGNSLYVPSIDLTKLLTITIEYCSTILTEYVELSQLRLYNYETRMCLEQMCQLLSKYSPIFKIDVKLSILLPDCTSTETILIDDFYSGYVFYELSCLSRWIIFEDSYKEGEFKFIKKDVEIPPLVKWFVI